MKKKAIAIITTILLSISIFMDTPFAEAHGPDNIVYTPYGTCTSEFYYDSANDTHNITLGGVTIPQKGPVNLLRYTFTHPYTGTFDLDITISGVLSNRWNLMTSNCYLVSVVDETTLRFAVNNASYCEIAIMPQYYNNKLVLWLENQNLTPVDDTVTAVNDILTHVSYIDGQIQQIHADTTMVRNLIISMSGYSADSNDNIATDMDTLISLMQTANNSIDSLVNIKWNDISYSSTFSNSLNGTYNNNYYQGHKLYVKLSNPSTILYNKNPIYKIRIPIKYISNENRFFDSLDIKVYGITGNNYIPADFELLNYSTYYNFIFVYLRLFNSCYDYVIEVNDPNYNIATDNNTTTVYGQYITEDIVPYWTVFNVLNQNKNSSSILESINGVINAINSMSMNVNQLTVNATGITYNVNNTQVNNSVNTYNTDIQNVYNVENDFSTSFNTYNQQFTPDFTETMTTIQSVPSVMNNVVVDLYNLPFIKYPLLLTLAGIVLIALLGV